MKDLSLSEKRQKNFLFIHMEYVFLIAASRMLLF